MTPGPGDDGVQLALRAQAGDRAAFGALYERYAPMVHGVLMSKVRVGEAPDLVQEVFLVALRSLASLKDPARVGAWLATIARNKALDVLRSGPRRAESLGELGGETSAAEMWVDPRPDEAAAAEEAEEAERALAAVRDLPEAYREPLVLRLVEGMSGPEIAERCGMTHGSVRVNLCRGMKLLRAALAAPEGARAERNEP